MLPMPWPSPSVTPIHASAWPGSRAPDPSAAVACSYEFQENSVIGRIRGVLLEKQAPDILVDVQGVGYEIQAPMSTIYQLPAAGKDVILHTHLVVREDAQLLYGFFSLQERSMFRSLIKVSGVGPKMA